MLQYKCGCGDSVTADLRSVFLRCWRRAVLIDASFLPLHAFLPAFHPACHPSPPRPRPVALLSLFPSASCAARIRIPVRIPVPARSPFLLVRCPFAPSLRKPRAHLVSGGEKRIATGSNSSSARRASAAASWIAQNYVGATNLCKCRE